MPFYCIDKGVHLTEKVKETITRIPLVKDVKKDLKEKFNIAHATIETELVECLPKS